MRMTAEHASRLYELMDLPHLSLRTKLVLARRIARHLSNERTRARLQPKRETGQTAAVFPCNIDVLRINRRRNIELDMVNRSLAAIGTWISQNEAQLSEDNGFDGICDLLNVNPVHRTCIRGHAATTNAGIMEIVMGAGLEDSAASLSGRNPAELKDGALYQTLWEEMKRAHARDRRTSPCRHPA
jgi:hypothetical protein